MTVADLTLPPLCPPFFGIIELEFTNMVEGVHLRVEMVKVFHIGDEIQVIGGNVASMVVFHQYAESGRGVEGCNPDAPIPGGTTAYPSHHLLIGACCPYLCGIVSLYFPEVGGMLHQ